MTSRRTVAPDIAGCSFLLYAATLFFPVLRAPYYHRGDFSLIARDIAVYGGLLFVCVYIAIALFLRRSWALWPAVLLSLAALAAGAAAWHVPDTAQLPAGVLGSVSAVLLIARSGEFRPAADDADKSAADPDD